MKVEEKQIKKFGEKIDILIEVWNEKIECQNKVIKEYNKAMKWFFRGLGAGIATGVLCACAVGLFLLLAKL